MHQSTVNFTRHIEDDYQRVMVTRVSFIYLSTAYDTVIHSILIQKLYNTRQHTMYILKEHAVQPKISGRAKQRASGMEKPEWLASGQCSAIIVVQFLH